MYFSEIGNEFFFRHMEFYSLLNMMTMNKIPRNTQEGVSSFQVILCLLLFCKIGRVRLCLKYTAVPFCTSESLRDWPDVRTSLHRHRKHHEHLLDEDATSLQPQRRSPGLKRPLLLRCFSSRLLSEPRPCVQCGSPTKPCAVALVVPPSSRLPGSNTHLDFP